MLALVATAALVSTAAFARAGVSPTCQAALNRITYADTMIKRVEQNLANPNITNSGKIVNPVRERQLKVRLARLQGELRAAQVAKAKACGKTPESPQAALAAYNGTYHGQFTGTRFTITFTVANGVLAGDLVSVAPLNPESGNVTVRATFAGADCGTPVLHLDAKTGTASARGVTCTLGGQSASGEFLAQRG